MSRNHRPSFKVDDKELKIIAKKAKQAALNTSEYLRAAALDKSIIVIENGSGFSELIKEVKRIGNNINQLTALCHQGRIVVVQENDLGKIKEKVNDIWRLLNSLTAKTRIKQD